MKTVNTGSCYLLPAGGTISSSNFSCVRFQIRNITDRNSSFASSMHPSSNKTVYAIFKWDPCNPYFVRYQAHWIQCNLFKIFYFNPTIAKQLACTHDTKHRFECTNVIRSDMRWCA